MALFSFQEKRASDRMDGAFKLNLMCIFGLD